MSREQDALLRVIARVVRSQLMDMPWPRRRDREDLLAIDNALLAYDRETGAKRAARSAELPVRATKARVNDPDGLTQLPSV